MPNANPPMFQWTSDYAVGVAEIDREHQWLFAAAEKMHQAMLAGQGKEALRSLLTGLVAYACDHISHEERLMERIGYPDLSGHRRQHVQLRAKVRELEARAAAGEATMTIEVAQFLIEWLKQHTISSDRRIAEYCAAKRISPPR